MFKVICFIFLSFLICSCQNQPTRSPACTVEVPGRSDPRTLSSREPVYRMQILDGWDIQIPPTNQSLVDTKEPLLILKKNDVTVTFHNFPVQNLSSRIPPYAQVSRWKNQFEVLDDTSLQIAPFAVAGFTGLQFHAQGTQKGNHVSVMAWSLQLAPELFQKLPEEMTQQKADWTLKAVGPPDSIELLNDELQMIASSIELLQEIPER